jgi:hypothetical protein
MAVDAGLMESGVITSNFRSWIGAQGFMLETKNHKEIP